MNGNESTQQRPDCDPFCMAPVGSHHSRCPVTAALPPDPTGVLTRLEELHQAATPGPWKQHPADGEYVLGAWVADDEYLDVADTSSFRENRGLKDAALIVAAVNALPALLAAVRGVLALAGELEGRKRLYDGPDAADAIRTTVAAALGETGGGK